MEPFVWTEYLLIGLMAAMLVAAWWADGVLGESMPETPQRATLMPEEWAKVLKLLRAIHRYNLDEGTTRELWLTIHQTGNLGEIITKVEEQTQ